jgi:RNA polymerase sigma-70 factor, ECF subfamily
VATGGSPVTAGDFEELVELYPHDLARLAFAMCGDRELAEDAAQACWKAAWQGRGTLRDPARMRVWLLTVTANEVKRQLRRQRLGRLLQGRLFDPAAAIEGGDPRNLDLAAAVHHLKLADRQLVGMRYGLGMNSDEIGPILGLSPSGTRRRLQRVLGELRKELEDE